MIVCFEQKVEGLQTIEVWQWVPSFFVCIFGIKISHYDGVDEKHIT